MLIALTGVVVDHIEHHFDVRLVKGLHHGAKLVVLATGRLRHRVGMVRGEEVQRHIAPGIPFLGVVLKDRHQLDDGDAQFLEVRNLFNEARVGAAGLRRDPGIRVLGESLDMQFVDDGVRFML